MDKIKKFKYKKIKNFLNKQELMILQKYCIIKLDQEWICDSQCPLTPSWYKDPLMDCILELKLKKMEKETGLKLLKTYAYWRYYMFNSFLENHKDRPSCEISATICIKKTDNWPIHMNNNWFELDEGDAIIYLGCDIEHGRKKFKGDGMAQLFLHYVDKNGIYKEHSNDKKI